MVTASRLSAAPPATRFAWINGEIVLAETSPVPLWTNALHYGTGVFEGIRAYPTPRGPALFRLRDHMERLHRSASFYHLAIPFSVEALCRAAVDLVREEGLDGLYVRPLAFFGEGPPQMAVKRGCPAETIILTRPLGAFLGEENYHQGLRLTVSTWRKLHHATIPTTAKGSGQYLNSVLAAHEAADRGFDDALLLGVDGTVAECTGANVFFVKDGRVTTNAATSSILMGITRDTVLQILGWGSVSVEVRPFTLAELLDADEVFITGTAAEVTPIREIDGRAFRTGAGTLSARLQRQYREIVTGRGPAGEDWLTPVLA